MTLWRQQTKSSPIFAKLLQPVFSDMLSSELFEFLRYLYLFQRYAKFSFSGFLTVCAYLKTYLSENYSAYRNFYAEFRTVGIFKIYLTVQKLLMKAFHFFNSVWPLSEAFLADFRLLHVQNVAEWALMKINQSCFLRQKAEMRSFAAKFILDI